MGCCTSVDRKQRSAAPLRPLPQRDECSEGSEEWYHSPSTPRRGACLKGTVHGLRGLHGEGSVTVTASYNGETLLSATTLLVKGRTAWVSDASFYAFLPSEGGDLHFHLSGGVTASGELSLPRHLIETSYIPTDLIVPMYQGDESGSLLVTIGTVEVRESPEPGDLSSQSVYSIWGESVEVSNDSTLTTTRSSRASHVRITIQAEENIPEGCYIKVDGVRCHGGPGGWEQSVLIWGGGGEARCTPIHIALLSGDGTTLGTATATYRDLFPSGVQRAPHAVTLRVTLRRDGDHVAGEGWLNLHVEDEASQHGSPVPANEHLLFSFRSSLPFSASPPLDWFSRSVSKASPFRHSSSPPRIPTRPVSPAP